MRSGWAVLCGTGKDVVKRVEGIGLLRSAVIVELARGMERVELFGAVAVSAMMILYALESRGSRFVLLFAGACAASSAYAALIAAWPFAAVEMVWAFVALRRWRIRVGPDSRPSA